MLLFADDTTFQISDTNLDSLYQTVNQQLAMASEWFTCNKLTLNISKTKFMVFRKNSMSLNSKVDLKIGTEAIERIGNECKTKSFKFVGHLLDEFLTWGPHIAHIRNKVACANFKINQCKNLLPPYILNTLYNSIVKPHLEFGIINWGSAPSKHLNTLIALQKKCVRTISLKKRFLHTNQLFANLKILKLKDLYEVKKGQFMFQQYNNLNASKSFDSLFVRRKSTRMQQFKDNHDKTYKLKEISHLPTCANLE